MARKLAKNKYQKRHHRRGEDRLRGDKIDLLPFDGIFK